MLVDDVKHAYSYNNVDCVVMSLLQYRYLHSLRTSLIVISWILRCRNLVSWDGVLVAVQLIWLHCSSAKKSWHLWVVFKCIVKSSANIFSSGHLNTQMKWPHRKIAADEHKSKYWVSAACHVSCQGVRKFRLIKLFVICRIYYKILA